MKLEAVPSLASSSLYILLWILTFVSVKASAMMTLYSYSTSRLFIHILICRTYSLFAEHTAPCHTDSLAFFAALQSHSYTSMPNDRDISGTSRSSASCNSEKTLTADTLDYPSSAFFPTSRNCRAGGERHICRGRQP